MPNYLFEHVETEEVVEIFFHMNDEKIYNGKNNDEIGLWRRIFCNPQAAIDTKWNAFSNQDFVEKSGKRKGSIGDLFDKSTELSEVRKDVLGKDPVREAALADWSKRRKGKKYVDPKEFKTKEI